MPQPSIYVISIEPRKLPHRLRWQPVVAIREEQADINSDLTRDQVRQFITALGMATKKTRVSGPLWKLGAGYLPCSILSLPGFSPGRDALRVEHIEQLRSGFLK